ncbi:MAG: peptidase M23, partial [Mycolicibacterium aromaticivorans]|nr:peptidase M23 [Mycolicibacterium aromaticivorans]
MGTTDLRFTWCRPALIVAISVAMTLSVPELAQAEPGPRPNSLAALIAEVAEASQQLQEVGAQVQAEQESVNKAIVEVQDARDAASAAQQQVDASEQAIKDAGTAIVQAQKRFDTFAAATYINGPAGALVMATNPDEIISSTTAGQTLAVSAEQVMTDLQRARTEQEIDRLAAERKTAQEKLDAARQWSAPAGAPAAVPQSAAPGTGSSGDRWDPAAPGSSAAPGDAKVPYGRASEWDLTLPAVPSAFASGDPIQIINAVLQIASTSMQTTQKLGKSFLQKLGILKPTDTGITNGQIPFVYGSTAVEYVIKRAMSQMGVPYSWGGGNADGPSRGIDSGANTIGFDCS